MKPYCRDFTVQLRIFQVYWGIMHAYLNTFYFCSILPCSVIKEKNQLRCVTFASVYLMCINTFAAFMPWAAILKDLEAQPSRVVNEKMGLQTASGPVTDMRPSGCSVNWTMIDCTDPGLCMQWAVNVSITAGKESRKGHPENKLLGEKGQFCVKLRLHFNSTSSELFKIWNLKLPGYQLSRLKQFLCQKCVWYL